MKINVICPYHLGPSANLVHLILNYLKFYPTLGAVQMFCGHIFDHPLKIIRIYLDRISTSKLINRIKQLLSIYVIEKSP